MKLKYVGPDPAELGIVPLPEGWPAEDHEEPDRAIAKEKLEHRVSLGINKDGSTHYGPNTFEEDKPKAEPSVKAEG